MEPAMSDEPTGPPMTDNAFLGPWQGGARDPTFAGALSFMRRRYSRALDDVDTVVWGVPYDAATSNRPGSRFGPQAIRRASAIFDGDPQFPSGLDPFADMTVVDWGDCPFDYRRPQDVPGIIEQQAADILSHGCHLVTLGGDHSITLPLLRAHAAAHGPLALVQFDAHQDTWSDVGGGSHGSFVTTAEAEGLIDTSHSIQIGIRTVAPDDFGIEIVDAYEARELGVSGLIRRIRERVGMVPAYLSFDIDSLDPAFAPGTGTPVAGGLSSADALMTLWGLRMLDWRGMDVVEVSPPYDHADITAIAAATVVQHYLQIRAEGGGG
jgi:agmatinase